jgi:hypothetical protein
MNYVKTMAAASLAMAMAVLAGCGGGGGDDSTPTPPTDAPGGLYVGYYAEDAATNPEDPTLGAFLLNLPTGSGAFTGNMFFTYVGCQNTNVGTVAGTKNVASLSGTWTGTVDGSPQAGTYSGSFSASTQSYSGVYGNNAGKQFIDRLPCISYHIAPHGAWEMFPVESNVPTTFNVSVAGRTINWTAAPNALTTLVYVIDPAIATTTGNPVLWQTALGAATTVTIPAGVALTPGQQYVAVVGIGNASHQRAAFGSRRFNAP